MSKIIVIPSSKNMIKELSCDGFIIGIEGYSVNLPCYFSMEDLKDLPYHQDIFIALNKNMHNEDLPMLEKILQELCKYPIRGVIYYDIALIQLKQKLSLPYDFVWSQEHLTTNATTAQFWYQEGAHTMWISSEITLREVQEIIEDYKGNTMLTVFGYLPMFVSKRHLVKNYTETFQLSSDCTLYYIEKEGKQYPIIDHKTGTEVYSHCMMNGIEEYNIIKNQLDYAVINSFQCDSKQIQTIIDCFQQVTEDNFSKSKEQIEKIVGNTSTFFLHKETVYKVKKNG